MNKSNMGGVVLAAGASSRMGRPKALLNTPRGIPLAIHQANLLQSAGCARVVIVVGTENIADELADERVVVHPTWAQGRASSLQAGLRNVVPCTGGVIVLPVDTVGMSVNVLHQLAAPSAAAAVRPVHDNQPGQVVWLSEATTKDVIALPLDPELRLDTWLTDRTVKLNVSHELGCNVNTPAEWEAARKSLDEELA